MNHAPPPPGQAAFYTALAALQAQLMPNTTTLEALALLPAHGLAWHLLPGECDDSYELRLCHAEGHGVAILANRAGLPLAFAGLIGHPAVLITSFTATPAAVEAAAARVGWPRSAEQPGPCRPEPDLIRRDWIEPAFAQAAVEAASASLAEATGGTVVEDAEPVDPSHSTEPLSEADRATTLDLVKAMTPETRKAFTIAFRDAFNVPREARAVAPLVTQERHRQFVVRFVNEVEGVPAP